jgi:hypothetical protein
VATRTVVSAPPVERPKPPRHPGRNKEMEDWLDAQGVEWTFHPEVPLDAFNENESLNNQVRFEPLKASTVEQYAKAMTEGAKFPPILVHTKRNKFVRLDGNHRVAAKRAIGDPTVNAYEAHVTGQAAVLLAFKANNRNGLPNTEEERIAHAIWLIRNGASLKAAAAETVVSERALKSAWTKQEANQRADEVGLLRTEWESLTPSVRGRLRSIATDEGFKAAAGLAYKAKLGIDEVSEIVTEMNQSKSGRKQEAVVKAYADNVYADRVRVSAGGVLASAGRGRGRTPRQALGMILSSLDVLPEDMGSLSELYAGSERTEAAQRTRSAGERLIALADKLAAEG